VPTKKRKKEKKKKQQQTSRKMGEENSQKVHSNSFTTLGKRITLPHNKK
jgi:hypothetical protein